MVFWREIINRAPLLLYLCAQAHSKRDPPRRDKPSHSGCAAQPISPHQFKLTLGAIFKNEADNIVEWIEHYLAEGADHFYLIDNGSKDSYYESVQPFVERGLLSLVLDSTPHSQDLLYNRHLKPVLSTCNWMAILDLDEFAYARNGTLAEYLAALPPNLGSVFLPWKKFGGSGHVEQPKTGLVENFVWRQNHSHGVDGTGKKSIFRCQPAMYLTLHETVLAEGYERSYPTQPLVFDSTFDRPLSEEELQRHVVHLNHYNIGSLEWFLRVKATRGDALNPASDTFRTREYYDMHDHRDTVDTELRAKKLARVGAGSGISLMD